MTKPRLKIEETPLTGWDRPHTLQQGYVTEAFDAGQPKEVTADRVDMTNDILEKHYDKATENKQMERREDYLKDI